MRVDPKKAIWNEEIHSVECEIARRVVVNVEKSSSF